MGSLLRSGFLRAIAIVVLGSSPLAAAPKYAVTVTEIKAAADIDSRVKTKARELLEAELRERPEFAGAAGAPARGIKRFDVSLTIEQLKEELRPPRPGGRLKQLALETKLTVFGATSGEAKLAFSGEGQASIEAEIIERRRAEEAATLADEALAQAIKQAVDEAVKKLSQGPSNASGDKKKRKK